MPAKPNTRTWNDVQIMILAISLVVSLTLWSFFASIEFEKYAQYVQTSPTDIPTAMADVNTPTPPQNVFLLLGGEAPTTPAPIVVQSNTRRNGGGRASTPGGNSGGGTGGS